MVLIFYKLPVYSIQIIIFLDDKSLYILIYRQFLLIMCRFIVADIRRAAVKAQQIDIPTYGKFIHYSLLSDNYYFFAFLNELKVNFIFDSLHHEMTKFKSF